MAVETKQYYRWSSDNEWELKEDYLESVAQAYANYEGLLEQEEDPDYIVGMLKRHSVK